MTTQGKFLSNPTGRLLLWICTAPCNRRIACLAIVQILLSFLPQNCSGEIYRLTKGDEPIPFVYCIHEIDGALNISSYSDKEHANTISVDVSRLPLKTASWIILTECDLDRLLVHVHFKECSALNTVEFYKCKLSRRACENILEGKALSHLSYINCSGELVSPYIPSCDTLSFFCMRSSLHQPLRKEIVDEIAKCKNLRSCVLGNFNIDTLQWCKDLGQLYDLRIYDSNLEKLNSSELLQIPGLAYLGILDCKFSHGLLENAGELSKLVQVAVKQREIDSTTIEQVCKLPHLRELYLINSDFTTSISKSLSSSKSLCSISIVDCKVDHEAIVHLSEVRNLEYLQLRSIAFPEEVRIGLKQLAGLQTLDVTGSAQTLDDVIWVIDNTKISTLHCLGLSDHHIEDVLQRSKRKIKVLPVSWRGLYY